MLEEVLNLRIHSALNLEVASLAKRHQVPPFGVSFVAIEVVNRERIACRGLVLVVAFYALPTCLRSDAVCNLRPIGRVFALDMKSVRCAHV
jgi:hypothetical protein